MPAVFGGGHFRLSSDNFAYGAAKPFHGGANGRGGDPKGENRAPKAAFKIYYFAPAAKFGYLRDNLVKAEKAVVLFAPVAAGAKTELRQLYNAVHDIAPRIRAHNHNVKPPKLLQVAKLRFGKVAAVGNGRKHAASRNGEKHRLSRLKLRSDFSEKLIGSDCFLFFHSRAPFNNTQL